MDYEAAPSPFGDSEAHLQLSQLSQRIVEAKTQGDIEALIQIEREFEALPDSPELWERLAPTYTQAREQSFMWPGQTRKHQLGAVLFYPTEADETCHLPMSLDNRPFRFPGVMGCLAMAAKLGDPIAFFHLARKRPVFIGYSGKWEDNKRIEDGLYNHALTLFRAAKEEPDLRGKYAQYYIILQNLIAGPALSYDVRKSAIDSIAEDLPMAYELLGEVEERRGDYHQAYANYMQAIDGGHKLAHLTLAIMLNKIKGGSCLQREMREHLERFDKLPFDSEMIEAHFLSAGGPGMYFLAKYEFEKGHFSRAIFLYQEAADLGCTEAYISLGEITVDPFVPGAFVPGEGERPKRTLAYFFQVDSLTNAWGSSWAAHQFADFNLEIALQLFERMMAFKDLRGYDKMLDYIKFEPYRTHFLGKGYSPEQLARDREPLARQRDRLLQFINQLAESQTLEENLGTRLVID